MRQLAKEGWIQNRARLIVGSFLIKDLGIDWKEGEKHFMKTLIDGDISSNNGNWQWIASVGIDPAPMTRRLYNPVLQQQKYDPHGHYVKKYVLELQNVPTEFLNEPWKMPIKIQKQSGCIIGQDYPKPIIEHAPARRATIERYKNV